MFALTSFFNTQKCCCLFLICLKIAKKLINLQRFLGVHGSNLILLEKLKVNLNSFQ